jgi:hypothetical protein
MTRLITSSRDSPSGIFFHQLLLQVFRAGRDDDALFFGERGGDRGHEVRHRLAGSRPGFDDQMLLFFERAQNGFRHFYLSGAVFVISVMFGDEPALTENFFHFFVFFPEFDVFKRFSVDS